MSDDDERALLDFLRAQREGARSKSDSEEFEALRRRVLESRARKQAAERRKPTESKPEDQPTDYGHDYGDLDEDILGKNVQVWPIARRSIVLMHVRTVGSKECAGGGGWE